MARESEKTLYFHLVEFKPSFGIQSELSKVGRKV